MVSSDPQCCAHQRSPLAGTSSWQRHCHGTLTRPTFGAAAKVAGPACGRGSTAEPLGSSEIGASVHMPGTLFRVASGREHLPLRCVMPVTEAAGLFQGRCAVRPSSLRRSPRALPDLDLSAVVRMAWHATFPHSPIAFPRGLRLTMTVTNEPDWNEERVVLRRFVLHRLKTRFSQGMSDTDVDCTVQDALVRLYRWYCRERDAGLKIRNLDAARNRVAKFAVVDLIREKVRSDVALPIGPPAPSDPEGGRSVSEPAWEEPQLVEAPERLRFVLTEFFRLKSAPCLEIAHQNLEGRAWQDVGKDIGISADAVKQRWSRCVKTFREYLAGHPEIEEWIFEEAS